ncbi:hypothetical protein B0H67DRAFT_1440 [Lasiosphaeris hirsuta]|uniref:Uncharacterized protein n=1 Tax=Lasiosphaeris hirsuta TaxID=260670 RepID=A0AA40E8Y0_9PEZI|nr:hypothetical protein B0H67DRAFT_1440 [Lasiosphaeris hirsuta]
MLCVFPRLLSAFCAAYPKVPLTSQTRSRPFGAFLAIGAAPSGQSCRVCQPSRKLRGPAKGMGRIGSGNTETTPRSESSRSRQHNKYIQIPGSCWGRDSQIRGSLAKILSVVHMPRATAEDWDRWERSPGLMGSLDGVSGGGGGRVRNEKLRKRGNLAEPVYHISNCLEGNMASSISVECRLIQGDMSAPKQAADSRIVPVADVAQSQQGKG